MNIYHPRKPEIPINFNTSIDSTFFVNLVLAPMFLIQSSLKKKKDP